MLTSFAASQNTNVRVTHAMKILLFSLSCLLTCAALLPSNAQTLGDALNAPYLTWTTGGNPWTAQALSTHDGVLAAMSGSPYPYESTLQTSVNGPGTLIFWWRSPSSNNRLNFRVGTNTIDFLTGYSIWQQKTFYLGSGPQTLTWAYAKASQFYDSLSGYVDEVSYTPGATAPLIAAQPLGQSQAPGFDALFRVTAGGSPPLSYQWRFNGQPIPSATDSSFTVTNVQVNNLGNYSVEITNAGGSILSSNAPLEFGEVMSWGLSGYDAIMIPCGATNLLAIAGGYYAGLALRADGALLPWGRYVLSNAIPPADLTNVAAISAGGSHCVAVRNDGTVVAWGDNTYGSTNVAPDLTNVVAVAAGCWGHTVALRSDGTVATWGGPYYYQTTNVPPGLSNVVALAAYDYSLALKDDGSVVAWGTRAPAVPTDLTNVAGIAAGGNHGVAQLADGSVRAWGFLTPPADLNNVVQVSANGWHAMALRSDGTVVTWAYNTPVLSSVPPGLTNVVAIATGQDQNFALLGQGSPIVQASSLHPELSGDHFSLTVPSQSGRVYRLEYSDSPVFGTWTALALVAGNGRDLRLTGPASPPSVRFYRVSRW